MLRQRACGGSLGGTPRPEASEEPFRGVNTLSPHHTVFLGQLGYVRTAWLVPQRSHTLPACSAHGEPDTQACSPVSGFEVPPSDHSKQPPPPENRHQEAASVQCVTECSTPGKPLSSLRNHLVSASKKTHSGPRSGDREAQELAATHQLRHPTFFLLD